MNYNKTIPLVLAILCTALPAAAEDSWFLFGRHGCESPAILVKAEALPRAPDSPEDFARMLEERGETVAVGLFEDAPPGLAGRLVQVAFGRGSVLLFAQQDVCLTVAGR